MKPIRLSSLLAAVALGFAGVPVAASDAAPLAGVSDTETTIPSGGITQFVFGHGDVLFLRDRTDRWYRVQLNAGCLTGVLDWEAPVIAPDGVSGRIDRFSRISFGRDGRVCRIASIRASVAPPQVDSKSPVTLD